MVAENAYFWIRQIKFKVATRLHSGASTSRCKFLPAPVIVRQAHDI